MKHRKKLSEFAGLELDLPKFDLPAPSVDISHKEIDHKDHNIESDDEGAMVKADLFKLAKYSVKLFKKIEDNDQFESWVQAKITKAADYISSVYHYLEYEMKFSEYGDKIEKSDMYSESEKRQMKKALMEARKTLAALKIDQADKLEKPKAVKEGVMHTCGECGGSGMVEKQLPASTKKLVNKHRILRNFVQSKVDANHNGIPDDEENLKGNAMDDEIITKKEQPKRPGSKSAESSAPKQPAKKTQPKKDSSSKSEPKKDSGEKKEKPKSSVNSQDTGNPYAKKETKTDESFYEGKKKPGGHLTSKERSKVAKDAKAGKDIGKPGKNFDKVAAKAGGGEKGKKIAAAAMWKNIKESVSYLEEKKAAKTADKDYDEDGKLETGPEEHRGAVDNAIKKSKTESAEINAIMRNSGLNEFKDDMGYDISPEEYAAQEKQNAQFEPMSQEPMSQGGKPISDADWKRAQQRMPGLFGPGADERQWAQMDRDHERAQQWFDNKSDNFDQMANKHSAQFDARMAQKDADNAAKEQDYAARRLYYSQHPEELQKYTQGLNQGMGYGAYKESTELDRLKMITERVIK